MTKKYEKTWRPGVATKQTLNAPGNFTVPYGRYRAVVSGRGGSGTVPNAATWNTNYNVAYPVGNRPIANQPAASWNTNYNTNYNVVYPVASTPLTGFNATSPGNATGFTNYGYSINVRSYFIDPYASGNQNAPWTQGPIYIGGNNTQSFPAPATITQYFVTNNYPGCQPPHSGGPQYDIFMFWMNQKDGRPPTSQYRDVFIKFQNQSQRQCTVSGYNSPIPGNANYVTNYNVAYPVANRPIANQPAASWNTNYNTNYNVVYPIASQPVATYTPGQTGTPINALGVAMPGGPIDTSQFGGSPGTATPITPTVVKYYDYPDGVTYPIPVPSGGQVIIDTE